MTALLAPERVEESTSVEHLEFHISCGIKGCTEHAQWAMWGSHSIFGCSGHGPVCEIHRQKTMSFVSKERPNKLGRCTKCGEPRIEGPEEFRVIEL